MNNKKKKCWSVINGLDYCKNKQYEKLRVWDNERPELREKMYTLGYAQLMCGRFETDGHGDCILNKLQFIRPGSVPATIRTFGSWNEVQVFVEGEQIVSTLIGIKDVSVCHTGRHSNMLVLH